MIQLRRQRTATTHSLQLIADFERFGPRCQVCCHLRVQCHWKVLLIYGLIGSSATYSIPEPPLLIQLLMCLCFIMDHVDICKEESAENEPCPFSLVRQRDMLPV